MKLIGRVLLSALLLLSGPALANDVSNGSYSTTDGGNNAAPPNGWPAGMFPNQVEPSARANMGATKRWWERANPTLSTTGSAGAYVITPTNTSYPTAYTQGENICAKANFTSVGSDTLNYNGLGAKPIYTNLGSLSAVTAGAIFTGAQFCVSYDAALNTGSGGWQLISATIPGGFLKTSNNLSELTATQATARTNLGLGTAATQNTGAFDAAGAATTAAAAAQAAAIAASMQRASNGSDISNTTSFRSNLGLGSQATKNITVSNSGPSGSANDGDVWLQW